MKAAHLAALACIATLSAPVLAVDNPFSAFKGKMKEGMYQYKMEMDMGQMPGLPPGMGKQTMNFERCLKQEDIDKGEFGKGRENVQNNCKVENLKMSGNTASYTMVCKGGPDMTADNVITFASDGFKMDMKMAMNQRGQVMNMTQHMEGKYLGPCK